MDDLISRQAAIDAIRASTSKYTGFMEMEMYTDDDAVEAINGVPSIDAVPVIHCNECKHSDAYNHCTRLSIWNKPEDFCSYAERRTDG